MAKRKETIPPVTFTSMKGSDFRDKLNGLRRRAVQRGPVTSYENVDLQNDFMINLDAKLFTGATVPKADGTDGRRNIDGKIAVNLGTLSNLDLSLLQSMGVELTDDQYSAVVDGTCDKGYSGHFSGDTFGEFCTTQDGGESYLPATPVACKVEYDDFDMSAKSDLDKYTITPAIDFLNIGPCDFAEKNRIREAKGKPALTPNTYQGREIYSKDVTASFPVTMNGLGGMNSGRVCQNVAKMASAEYMMKKSGAAVPTAGDVKTVSELYDKTFREFVKSVEKKDCPPMLSVKDGKPLLNDKGEPIQCPSLSSIGVKPVEVNGALVLAVVGDENSKGARKDGLAKFSEAFTARWKQVVNERDTSAQPDAKGNLPRIHNDAVVNMGNNMEMNAYAVTTRNPYDRSKTTGLVIVQPRMDYTMSPTAGALGRSIAVATHQLDVSTYDKDHMERVNGLYKSFEEPDIDEARAIEANAKQFNDICKAIKKDPQKTMEEPKKGGAEGPEAGDMDITD